MPLAVISWNIQCLSGPKGDRRSGDIINVLRLVSSGASSAIAFILEFMTSGTATTVAALERSAKAVGEAWTFSPIAVSAKESILVCCKNIILRETTISRDWRPLWEAQKREIDERLLERYPRTACLKSLADYIDLAIGDFNVYGEISDSRLVDKWASHEGTTYKDDGTRSDSRLDRAFVRENVAADHAIYDHAKPELSDHLCLVLKNVRKWP